MAKKIFTRNSMALKCRRLISQEGATWEDLSAVFDYSVKYLQKCVKESYSREGDYKNLLKKARLNKAAKQKAEAVLPQEINEVILVDTGFLMRVGVKWIMQQSLDIYIPSLCIRELEGLSRSYKEAEDLLTYYWASGRIAPIDLYGEEDLWEEPVVPVRKPRTRGIVAVAVKLDSLGKKVRLYTNSKQVEWLALHQGSEDIDVIYQPNGEVK